MIPLTPWMLLIILSGNGWHPITVPAKTEQACVSIMSKKTGELKFYPVLWLLPELKEQP